MHLVTISVDRVVALSTISHIIEILLGIARVRYVSLFVISYAAQQAPRANVELPLEKNFLYLKGFAQCYKPTIIGKIEIRGTHDT